MDKSYLIIDTPKNCRTCPLCVGYKDKDYSIEYWCPFVPAIFDESYDEKSEYCPLKKMPNKREKEYNPEDLCDVADWYDDGFIDGFNDCLDTLMD